MPLQIAELQKKYDNLLKDTTTRQQELESAMLEAKNIRDTLDYIMPELIETETELLKAEKPGFYYFFLFEFDAITLTMSGLVYLLIF